jgi:hypothetical protein
MRTGRRLAAGMPAFSLLIAFETVLVDSDAAADRQLADRAVFAVVAGRADRASERGFNRILGRRLRLALHIVHTVHGFFST